jgi:hypothetical protein
MYVLNLLLPFSSILLSPPSQNIPTSQSILTVKIYNGVYYESCWVLPPDKETLIEGQEVEEELVEETVVYVCVQNNEGFIICNSGVCVCVCVCVYVCVCVCVGVIFFLYV